MAEDGFDFQTPERREAKRFEPPPWEREAFEELERKRAEQQEAEAIVAPQPAPDEPQQEAEEEADEANPVNEMVRPPAVAPEDEGPAAGQNALDEARVAEMLADLSAQEPRDNQSLWRVAVGAAVLLGAIGAVLIVWAMAALVGARRTGAVGWASGFVLLFFGAGFVAGAWWLTVRTLRQRGVL